MMYSPCKGAQPCGKNQTLLFKGPVGKVRERMRESITGLLGEGKKVGVLLPAEDLQIFNDLNVETVNLGSESDLEAVGRNLFSGMRELDNHGLDVILVRSLNSEGLGLAILDRMIRASEGKIIEV